MSKVLKLIEKPKTYQDRENNKLYYQQKGFSKSQLETVEKNKKLAANAMQVIASRGSGGSNPLDGGISIHKKVKRQSTPISPVILPPIQKCDLEETKERILSIAESVQEDWDSDF
jgi:hypothetical protein